MSIASEISRLQSAKADLKSAIEAKGVTVSSSATLDDYDTYVAAISGGGSSVSSGTFTTTEDTGSYTISTLAGTTATHFVLVATPSPSAVTGHSKRAFAGGFISWDDTLYFSVATAAAGTSVNTLKVDAAAGGNAFSLNKSTGVVSSSTGTNGGGYLINGVTYKWYAW